MARCIRWTLAGALLAAIPTAAGQDMPEVAVPRMAGPQIAGPQIAGPADEVALWRDVPPPPPPARACRGSQWRRWASHGANVVDKFVTWRTNSSGRGQEANPIWRIPFGKRLNAGEAVAAAAISSAAYEIVYARASARGCDALRQTQTVHLVITGATAIYMTVRWGF